MKFASILIAVVAIAIASVITSDINALYEDHPMHQPLAHDVADIPPIEMTGQAAVAVWMECTAVTTGWTATPYPCEGRDLPYTGMYGYDLVPAPAVLTEDRDGYNDWSLDTTNSRALRAFLDSGQTHIRAQQRDVDAHTPVRRIPVPVARLRDQFARVPDRRGIDEFPHPAELTDSPPKTPT